MSETYLSACGFWLPRLLSIVRRASGDLRRDAAPFDVGAMRRHSGMHAHNARIFLRALLSDLRRIGDERSAK